MIVIVLETVLLVLAFGFAFFLDIDLLRRIAVTPEAAGWGVAAAVLPHMVLAPATLRPGVSWAAELRERVAGRLRRLFGHRPGPMAYIALGYAGIAEEVLFRGVLVPALGAYMPAWLAVVIVGVGFGLLHPVSRLYMVLAALLGIFWGALYIWSGNLLIPMIAHALNNVVALAYYSRLQRT